MVRGPPVIWLFGPSWPSWFFGGVLIPSRARFNSCCACIHTLLQRPQQILCTTCAQPVAAPRSLHLAYVRQPAVVPPALLSCLVWEICSHQLLSGYSSSSSTRRKALVEASSTIAWCRPRVLQNSSAATPRNGPRRALRSNSQQQTGNPTD